MKEFSKDIRHKILVPFMLLVILLAALLLRVFQLDAESLWLDEATSFYRGDHSFVEILRIGVEDPNPHPPLYYLFLHYWMQLFGDSEFSLRLPSVLFGVFSVAMLYKIGTLLFNKRTGLISAFIMAISGYQIHYSQEVRAYMLMVLLALISFYFFLKLFEGKNYWILTGYVLSSTTLMYTHYYGHLLVLTQALFVLGFYARRRHPNNATTTPFRSWGLAAGAIVVLHIPGFFYLAYQLTQRSNYVIRRQTPSGFSDVSTSFLQYVGAPYVGAPAFPSLLILAILTLFALIAVRVLVKREGERMALSLLLLWLIVPVALPILLSQISNLAYAGRYSIAALPALYLLVAVGMQRVGSVAMRASTLSTPVALAGLAVTVGLFSVTGILYLSILHDYFTSVKKEQWRDLARDVKTYAEPGDAVVISQEFMATPYNYYTRGNELPDTVIPLRSEKAKDVGYEVRGANRVWLLLSHVHSDKQIGQFKASLEGAGFKVAGHKRYKGIDVTLHEKE